MKGLASFGFYFCAFFQSGGIGEAANLLMDLRENHHIFCSMVIYPVVPKGVIILRIIPTAAHTLEDVEETIKAFESIQEKLSEGWYKKEKLIEVTSR